MNISMIDGRRVEQLLPMAQAIDVLASAFGRPPLPVAPPRAVVPFDQAQFIVMPTIGADVAGAKLLTIDPDNPSRGAPLIQGLFVLFAGPTRAPRLIVDGAALTRLRTAAVSGLATRFLSRKHARRLVIFGAGVQAHAHLEAMCSVRPIESVAIVDPDPSRVQGLVAAAERRGLVASAANADAVADADIVCTCTTSAVPVFHGAALAAGAHVNAMGAFQPDTREVDDATVQRARIVVEQRDAALAEAGDLLIPMQAGAISRDVPIAELSDVVVGDAARDSEQEITLFKSVGIAFEDLIIADAVAAAIDIQEGPAQGVESSVE
jgi:ornithine cyclodeaminase